ncbi:MAG: serine hydrolase domain-containing protein [Sandaracinus sp.]
MRRLVAVPADLDEVIDQSGREVDPALVGMDTRAIERIWRAILALYRTGTQPGIAIVVRRRGEVVLERAIGHARGAPMQRGWSAPEAIPLRHDTPFCIFSVSKAVTAMLVHLLDDRGVLHVDDPIAEHVPEFATHGKERTSIRHVLTHRAGIPSVAGNNDPELLVHWDRVIDLLCDAHPTSVPGRRLAYHAVTGGYVLGEVIRRATGKRIEQHLEDELARPLGFEWFRYGVPPGRETVVAENVFTGSPIPAPLAFLVKRALGVSFEEAVRISNDARYLHAVVPSGNVVATAYEVATFFDLLRQGGSIAASSLRGPAAEGHGEVSIFSPRTVRRALTESSYLELDLTLAAPVRYGLGLMLGGDTLSLYGPGTPSAFGHLGFINVLGWADPEREISVAVLTSGKPFLGTHLVPLVQILRTIAHEVPKTGAPRVGSRMPRAIR